jgi:hypothetical protein
MKEAESALAVLAGKEAESALAVLAGAGLTRRPRESGGPASFRAKTLAPGSALVVLAGPG